MIGIYKITNKITSKVYIGQSVDIEKRWRRHRNAYNNPNRKKEYNLYLYRSMRKYGIENFTFEVIEECLKEELDDKEKYWISYYDSFKNGYNETAGGKGAGHSIKINSEQLEQIDNCLRQLIPIGQIAKMFSLSYGMIRSINTGEYWHRDNIQYPIGKYFVGGNGIPRAKNHCIECGKEIDRKAKRCVECANIHKRKVERIDKISLLKLIVDKSFLEIGRICGVSDKAIRKWCDSYGIPKNKKDVLKYIEDNNICLSDQ